MSDHDQTLPPDPDSTQILAGTAARHPATGGEAATAASTTGLFTHSQPSRIGRYRPLRVLGQGGMGVVYEAEQDEPRRRVALAFSGLGGAHLNAGRFDDAERCLREALHVRREVFGDTHLAVASSLQDLGVLERARGRFDEAVDHFDRSQAVLDQLPDAVSDLASMNAFDTAMVWQDRGDHGGAEPHFRRALAILRAAHPGAHPQVAKAMSNLATNLFRQCRKDDAAAVQGEALAMLRELDIGGEALWLALGNTAFLLDDAGRHADAAPLHAETIEVSGATFGADQPQLADARARYVDNLARRGLWAEAFEQAGLVADWRRRHLPPGDWRQAVAGALVAEALAGLGRVAEADRELAAAEALLAANTEAPPRAWERVRRVRGDLAARVAKP